VGRWIRHENNSEPIGTLRASEWTLPEVLDRSGVGYAHACIGKWHVADGTQPLSAPLDPGGFDHFAGFLAGQLPSYYGWEYNVNGVETRSTTYATTRQVMGGVYPLSNDGVGAEGTEQAGWPMPFDTVSTGVGPLTADSGGNLPICLDGDITSSLTGEFIAIHDFCGEPSLTSAGDLDFSTHAGTDCTTPGIGGDGNTHASRTAFYQLNRAREQAIGQLPANVWLQDQLRANTNYIVGCNAAWDGSEVTYLCSATAAQAGAGFPTGCANTGELAGSIDHEWGHGMDDNDAIPTISDPGEGIADVYAYLRTDVSCIGRGFRIGTNCGGYGDACTACDGARE
ncbi:hypothetical protein, partial [Rheinheimera sp.]|uniref:hypothetical protein n=1 Tax=Rheinheimera sp. TaxID=1869214 RepID=UPI003AF4A73B